MKNFSLKYLVLLLFSFVLITGCDDDDDDEDPVSAFVGDYIISEATILAIQPEISTNEIGTIPNGLIVGTDITEAIQLSLLSQVNCASADKSWIELRKDETMYMSCEGSNELNAGTWSEVSATVLKLNMNGTAIPSAPNGFALDVTDIIVDGAKMKGNTGVPLPKEMVAGLVAQLGASMGQTLTLTVDSPDTYMASFSIVFVKQ